MAENIYKTFGRLSNGYPLPVVKDKAQGVLLLDGLQVGTPAPFPILNMIKSRDYGHIFPKSRLKIVSLIVK